jgi:hypothetical protein
MVNNETKRRIIINGYWMREFDEKQFTDDEKG